MCLLLIAVDAVPRTPLLLLGNRDEFHERASAAIGPWNENPQIVGGRDLVAGGSWLAIRDDGRFAAVTNVRSGLPATAPRSRGWLVRDFVLGEDAAADFVRAVQRDAEDYGPFNLIVGDRDGVFALGSGDGEPRAFGRGVHVVSNGPLGVHWPKTERLEARFLAATANGVFGDSVLLDLLGDEWRPADDALPQTGIGLDRERMLAPVFVRGSSHYGTRASTLARIDADQNLHMRERRFAPLGAVDGESAWTNSGGAWTPMR